jgi:hypothetical protein
VGVYLGVRSSHIVARALYLVQSRKGSKKKSVLFVTGDGSAESARAAAELHIDTTGDGIADSVAVDTTGDGIVDTVVKRSDATGVPPEGAQIRKSVPIDTTGDGIADSTVVDTTGDGMVDTVVKLSVTLSGACPWRTQCMHSHTTQCGLLTDDSCTVCAGAAGAAGGGRAMWVDTIGDGKADSIAIDTNGDGRVDTILSGQVPPTPGTKSGCGTTDERGSGGEGAASGSRSSLRSDSGRRADRASSRGSSGSPLGVRFSEAGGSCAREVGGGSARTSCRKASVLGGMLRGSKKQADLAGSASPISKWASIKQSVQEGKHKQPAQAATTERKAKRISLRFPGKVKHAETQQVAEITKLQLGDDEMAC